MSEERHCISENYWAVYERVDGSDDAWAFLAMGHAEEPGTAARVIAARHWTGGKHFLLAAGLGGAYEYEINIDSSGPVV